MVGLGHSDNKDWIIHDQRDDIRLLLVYANRVLQNVKNIDMTFDRAISIDCLNNSVKYLAKKYNMEKLIK